MSAGLAACIHAAFTWSKKKRTKASAPFSVFSRAAAGTSTVALTDGLGDGTDGLGDPPVPVPVAVADGLDVTGGVASDSQPASAPAPTRTPTSATAAASPGRADGIPIVRRPMLPSPAAPRRPARKR